METIGARKANPLVLYGCDAEFSGLLCCVHAGDVGQMNCANRVSLGCDLPCVRDLAATITDLKQQNLEFVVMPLVHPR